MDVHSKPGVDGSIIGPAGETREGTDLDSSGGRGDRDRWSIVQPDEVGYKINKYWMFSNYIKKKWDLI